MGDTQSCSQNLQYGGNSATVHLPIRRRVGPLVHSVINSLYSITKFDRLQAYPLVQFLVIVNPNSGPGSNNTLNDPNFVREIPRLNSYPNVRTIGYVRTGWTTRNMSLVLDDVATYASWESTPNPYHNGTFALNGIFYDEAPNNYTDAGQQYMNTIDAYVKNNTNFGSLKLVVAS